MNALTLLRPFLLDERGATSIEYALIATVVSVGIIGSLSFFAESLSHLWTTVASNVTANL